MLPALAFPTKTLAVAYVVSFGVGTVAAMAIFSWGIGRMTTRFSGRGQSIYRGMMTTCGLGALGVGVFWLASSFH